jgi:hypothetical protein
MLRFHSIEDRIVKQFIQQHSKQKQLPKGLPIMDSGVEHNVSAFSFFAKFVNHIGNFNLISTYQPLCYTNATALVHTHI